MTGVRNIRETIDGWCGVYVDREGNVIDVTGTFALGPALSWKTATGQWVEVLGTDQGRVFPQTRKGE